MRKFGVAFARGLMMTTAISMTAASVAPAQSAAAPASKYPIKFANGTSVQRGSQPGVESCTVHGLRAQPEYGKETGPAYVGVAMAFDEKGNRNGYGQVQIQPVETSVTHFDERPVQVRIDLDGTTYDIPFGKVHQAIVTFLDFRFPGDLLNKIANAKSMKVYFVDPQTKAAKLFATADLSSGREAFAELARCVDVLPDLPTKVGEDWTLRREHDGCAMETKGLAVARDNNGLAGLIFTEIDDSHEFTEATKLAIGGKPVKFDYSYFEGNNSVTHVFKFPATDLDRLTQDASLEITDAGEKIISGASAEIYPPAGLFYLKKCAAGLKPAAKPKT